MKKKTKQPHNRLKGACVALGVLVFLAATDAALLFANIATEKHAHARPSYARADITQIIQKQTFDKADYELLYLQTGLSMQGVNRLREACDTQGEFHQKILGFQDALFLECTIAHERVSPVTLRDYTLAKTGGDNAVEFSAPLVPLRNGDIFVTSVCHTFGWRHGHSALVVNEHDESVLESVTVGENSTVTYGGSYWFQDSSNFMVLRLKDEYRSAVDPAEVATQAVKTLFDIPYSLTVGVFTKKDQGTNPRVTHCSHLVWQAYKNFGIDLDGNGGAIVTSRDIANSPYLEVVQVYGFDPVKLWK